MNIQDDFRSYLQTAEAGSIRPFAAGTLIMHRPTATYQGPDGTITFDEATDLEELYAIPSIKQLWNKIYGKPFAMAIRIPSHPDSTEIIEDTQWVRVLSRPEGLWIHPIFNQALNLAARITAKKFPLSDKRTDDKLTVVQAGAEPGKCLPTHSDSGKQVDLSYYCFNGMNYTQYSLSGGPTITKIWDGWVLNEKFDPDRNAYFPQALKIICPKLSGVMFGDIKKRCGLKADWIWGDESKGDLHHWEHAHFDMGVGPSIDKRFSEMTFFEAWTAINKQIETGGIQ